jgi:L,D-peptidoglycan transpeptidase YkuD (ErfK/YbiS/YcfS/YnhG family)
MPAQAEPPGKANSRSGRLAADSPLSTLRVASTGRDPSRGTLVAGGLTVPCALGRGGIHRHKREGDGVTPAGRWRLVSVFYRPDRVTRPRTSLPAAPLRPDSGWCDDPADRRYNRPVRLPYPASHERLWRDDHLYDLLVVVDHNLVHPVRGAGSAIFLHLAAPDFSPTAGCVAVTGQAMRRLLARSGPGTALDIR